MDGRPEKQEGGVEGVSSSKASLPVPAGSRWRQGPLTATSPTLPSQRRRRDHRRRRRRSTSYNRRHGPSPSTYASARSMQRWLRQLEIGNSDCPACTAPSGAGAFGGAAALAVCADRAPRKRFRGRRGDTYEGGVRDARRYVDPVFRDVNYLTFTPRLMFVVGSFSTSRPAVPVSVGRRPTAGLGTFALGGEGPLPCDPADGLVLLRGPRGSCALGAEAESGRAAATAIESRGTPTGNLLRATPGAGAARLGAAAAWSN